MVYVCERCEKVFAQKNDYRRHINRKNPCVPESVLEKGKSTTKKLERLLKELMDILRGDSKQIVGKKAMSEIFRFIILMMLERQTIEGLFDLSESDYDEDVVGDRLDLVWIRNMVKWVEEPKNRPIALETYRELIGEVFGNHPETQVIFEGDSVTQIESNSVFIKFLKSLQKFDYINTSFDTLGDMYEMVYSDNEVFGETKSKALMGQFFTPHTIAEYIISVLNPTRVGNEFESIGDPAAGTGGFLTRAIRAYQIIGRGLKMTEKEIQTALQGTVRGCEIDPDTHRLLAGNILAHSGTLFPQIRNANSVFAPPTEKVKIVVANPPFALKIDPDEILQRLGVKERDRCFPIAVGKSSSEIQFLQLIISMMEKNGRGGVVLPDGEKISGKNAGFKEVREMLCRQCDVTKVVSFPAGLFTHTCMRTVVFFFTKKYDTVFEWDSGFIRREKSGLKHPIFQSKMATKEVEFADFNESKKTDSLIRRVGIDQIVANDFSLSVTSYCNDEKTDYGSTEKYRLGEICRIESGQFASKDAQPTGQYPFYSSKAQNPTGWLDGFCFDSKEKYVIITKDGGSGEKMYGDHIGLGKSFLAEGKAAATGHNLALFPVDSERVDPVFLFYTLRYRKNQLMDLAKYSTGLGHIGKGKISEYEIPVPPIEEQRKIVGTMNEVDRLDHFRNELHTLDRQLASYIDAATFGCRTVPLSEVSNLNPPCSVADLKRFDYVEISGVNRSTYTPTRIDENDKVPSRARRRLKKNDVIISTVRPNLRCCVMIDRSQSDLVASTGFCQIRPDQNRVWPKYLYYVMKSNRVTDFLVKRATGASYPAVNTATMREVPFPLPNFAQQREIIDRCAKIEEMIQTTEQSIETDEEKLPAIFSQMVTQKPYDQIDHTDHPSNRVVYSDRDKKFAAMLLRGQHKKVQKKVSGKELKAIQQLSCRLNLVEKRLYGFENSDAIELYRFCGIGSE